MMSSQKFLSIVALSVVITGLCIFLCKTQSATDTPKYLATAILFRHGQRTAIKPVGNIYCAICEDIGYGQLTRNGSIQLYDLGVFLRSKYRQLFPAGGRYRESNMRILSSAGGRTSMSLQYFMVGFFPGPSQYDDNLPKDWQPFYFDLDYSGKFLTIKLEPQACPKYFTQLMQALQLPPFSLAMSEDRELMDSLSKLFQTPITNVSDFIFLIDSLNVYKNLAEETIPQWAIDMYDNQLIVYHRAWFHRMHHNQEMVRYRAGLVMTEVVSNFRAVAAEKGTRKNFSIYSGHDINLYSWAFAMGVADQLPQEVLQGDTLMIDLIAAKGETGEPQVQVVFLSYRNGSYLQFPLKVNGMDDACPLSEFINATQHVIATEGEIDAYCAG